MSESEQVTLTASPVPQGVGLREWIGVGCIVLAAAAMRLVALDQVPPGMNQDEVIKGYDAWCLWQTGADYRGTRWPAFLGSFGPGDSPSAVSAYLTAPFVGLLGPSVTAARLPIALCGVLTVALTWWWVRAWLGTAGGLAAAAVLAVNPWLQQISRLAFEGSLTPLFIVLGLAMWLRPQRTSGALEFLGGLSLGIGVWSYHGPRVAAPLIAMAAWMLLGRSAGGAGRRMRWMLAGAAIGAAPLWVSLATHPGQVFGRAEQVALFRSRAHAGADLLLFARHYARHFDPRVLFLTGDGYRHQSVPGVGLLHYYEAPLLLVGAVVLIARARRDAFARFVIAWWLIYPLPASLARDGGPHAVRDATGLPLAAIVEGMAVQWLVLRAAGWTARVRRAGLLAAGVLVLGNTGWYADHYFRTYPREAAGAFQAELPEAFAWIGRQGGAYDLGLFAYPANQPFAYYLFFTPVEPRAAQGAGVHRDAWVLGFEEVLQFDRWLFCPARERRAWEQADVDRILAGLPAGRRVLIVARAEQRLDGRTVTTIADAAGRPAALIREIVTR